MPASTAENLVSLIRSAAKLTIKRSASSSAATTTANKTSSTSASSAAAASSKKKPSSSSSSTTKKKHPSTSSADAALKTYVSSINSSVEISRRAKSLLKNFKTPRGSFLHDIVNDSVQSGRRGTDEESSSQLLNDASGLLYEKLDLDWDDESEDMQSLGNVLDFTWLEGCKNTNISLRRKQVAREKKQKWVFKNTQTDRFDKLVKMCAKNLGPDAAIEVFGKLGRETGLKEYNALIRICIDKARNAPDDDASLEQIYKAYQIFKVVRETGFKIEEETYGLFLMYLIDSGMVDEFNLFNNVIKEDNAGSLPRLAYYEMLLWIRVNNELKIQELCRYAVSDCAVEKSGYREHLLLALCESDRKEEFIMLLKTVDITKIPSVAYCLSIFRSLGKLSLNHLAEGYLLALKNSDTGMGNISNFICDYVISIPNLAVEEIITKFQGLHSEMEVLPTSAEYEKLIRHCCKLLKVHEAFGLVDKALESGVALSLETFHSILEACDQSCEFNLVHHINSMIRRHNLKPNTETFRLMILLYVKMKDFEGAYGMIDDLQMMKLKPTAGMFNCIMSGYFREKNMKSAMNVLKQMEYADVQPDAMTFSHLIANSQSEKDIVKFYDDMCNSGVTVTKHVFMALINAYAARGEFEKAKQVISNKRIPVKNLNEIKNVLIGALASYGRVSGALQIYEEIKDSKCNLEPKAIRCIIEHFQSEGALDKSLQLLAEIKDSPCWVDACFRVVKSCVRLENLRCTVDLLNQLQDNFVNAEVAGEVLFDEVFCLVAEKEVTDMQFALDLLQAIKEELGARPSRKSLDFLLSACVKAKDSRTAFVIWKEYEIAGLPYNVLSFVRMYQALLASGDRKSAQKILNKIPKDDPHVRCVIKACNETFIINEIEVGKKKGVATSIGLLDGFRAKTGK